MKKKNKARLDSPGNFGQYSGKVQPFHYFAANAPDAFVANIIKYSVRHGKKGGKEDVLKALWYLARLQEVVDNEYDQVSVDDFIEAQQDLDEDQISVLRNLDKFLSGDSSKLSDVRESLDNILSNKYGE